MRIVNAKNASAICLGKQGENNVTTVIFDISGWEETIGQGTFTLIVKRNGDENPYPKSITREENYIKWIVSNSDTEKAGYGSAELIYTVDDAVEKSTTFLTITAASVGRPGPAPAPWQSWVDNVINAAAFASGSAEEAAQSATDAGASAEKAARSATDAGTSAEEAARSATDAEEAAQSAEKAKEDVIDALSEYRTAEEQDVIDRVKVNTADYNPSAKTAAMTQAVGKDADGKLWAEADGNIQIVNVESTDGVNYTGTVDNLTVKNGTMVVIVPSKTSTTVATYLSVNGTNKPLRQTNSGGSGFASAPTRIGWLQANNPMLVIYDAIQDRWKSWLTRPLASDLEGRVSIEQLDSTVNTLLDKAYKVYQWTPDDTSLQNQLANQNFVNSSIATNTAHYVSNNGQPFSSLAQLESYSGTVTNNDYAFVTGTDEAGNTYFDRYKATVSGTTVSWAKEYRLNNSSFTAAQWAAIESGITSGLVDLIETALQPSDLIAYRTSADQDQLDLLKASHDEVAVVNNRVTDISSKIPASASALNQLITRQDLNTKPNVFTAIPSQTTFEALQAQIQAGNIVQCVNPNTGSLAMVDSYTFITTEPFILFKFVEYSRITYCWCKKQAGSTQTYWSTQITELTREDERIFSYRMANGALSPLGASYDNIVDAFDDPDEWKRNGFVGFQTLHNYMNKKWQRLISYLNNFNVITDSQAAILSTALTHEYHDSSNAEV